MYFGSFLRYNHEAAQGQISPARDNTVIGEREEMSRLNHLRRAVSGLLSLALTSSFCTIGYPAALAASGAEHEADPTGSIALTVRFDLPQQADEVADRDLRLTLTGSGKAVTVSLADGTADGADGLAVSVEAQNIHGVPLTTEEQIGYYQVTVDGLATGDYTMALSGRGYTTCPLRWSWRPIPSTCS